MPRHHVPSLLILVLILIMAACQSVPAVPPTPAPEQAPTAVPPTAAPPTATAVPPTATPNPPTATPVPPTATPAPQPVLEIVGPSGSKSFTLDELKKLPATEGQAGMKSSTGKITLPALHRGVALKDLAALVGGLDPTMGINVVARDGYGITFSYDQLTKGTFIAYDPAIGDELKSPPELTAILAYERDGQPLPEESDGILRVVIVSARNDQVTDGHWSVKWAAKIEVKPLVADWTLKLHGAISQDVDRATFESCAQCHKATWTDDKAQVWVGAPLWMLLGYMDDEVKHNGPAFNDALAKAGYTFDVVAADGYKATFDSARVARNNDYVVAYLVNDNPLPEKYAPLRLVGPALQKNEQIGAIAEIDLHLTGASAVITPTVAPTVAPTAAPTEAPAAEVKGDLILTGAVNKPLGLTEADLRAMEVVKITAEHPKSGKAEYEGVRLSALLALAGPKAGAATIAFTANDGYTAEAKLAEIQGCADCLVAFTETPGKLKLIMPGLSSGLWVKGVVKIEVK